MNYRNWLIKLFTFLGGIYFFLEFLLPKTIFGYEFGKYNDQISEGFVAIGALTFGLGLFNLLSIHGSKIIFAKKGWINSLGLLLGLIATIAIATLDWTSDLRVANRADELYGLRDFSARIVADAEAKTSENLPAFAVRLAALNSKVSELVVTHLKRINELPEHNIPEADPASSLFKSVKEDLLTANTQIQTALVALQPEKEFNSVSKQKLEQLGASLGEFANKEVELFGVFNKFTLVKALYAFMYDGLYVGLSSAMFSLLGFYIAGAAYRAFRIRSMESALMMTAALIVMLGQIPFGLWIWSGFPELRLWILKIPNAAAFRAIAFGASIAGLIMSFRMWLSIDSEEIKSDKMGAKK